MTGSATLPKLVTLLSRSMVPDLVGTAGSLRWMRKQPPLSISFINCVLVERVGFLKGFLEKMQFEQNGLRRKFDS